jgi:hypothetical protein
MIKELRELRRLLIFVQRPWQVRRLAPPRQLKLVHLWRSPACLPGTDHGIALTSTRERIGCRGQGPAGGEKITAPSICAGPQRCIRERASDNLEMSLVWIGSIPESLFDGKYIDESLRIWPGKRFMIFEG